MAVAAVLAEVAVAAVFAAVAASDNTGASAVVTVAAMAVATVVATMAVAAVISAITIINNGNVGEHLNCFDIFVFAMSPSFMDFRRPALNPGLDSRPAPQSSPLQYRQALRTERYKIHHFDVQMQSD